MDLHVLEEAMTDAFTRLQDEQKVLRSQVLELAQKFGRAPAGDELADGAGGPASLRRSSAKARG